MDAFTTHTGIAAPLLRPNIDTDAIIPSREMKTVSKAGLADGLFAGWRYVSTLHEPSSRELNPDFVLNQPPYKNATVLLAGANFGCGSSREHAVWALKEYGFKAIIAPSFGAIFFGNCVRNGLLPITLNETSIKKLADACEANPEASMLTIDLARQIVQSPNGEHFNFPISALHHEMLLHGLDPIALTLKMESAISSFQDNDKKIRPWIYTAKPITPS